MPNEEIEGPHQLPYGDRLQFTIEARRLGSGGGNCNVMFIYDSDRQGWVMYPHGIPDLAIFLSDKSVEDIVRKLSS